MSWREFLSLLSGNSPQNDKEDSDEGKSVSDELFPEDFDKVIVDKLPPGELYRVKRVEGEHILVVDMAQADDAYWEAAKSELREEFANAGGISVETASPIVSAYSSDEGQRYIEKISEFYEDKLPSRINRMIRESLVLRLATDTSSLSFEEVRRRKRQIAKYGDEGFSIASLCSAGYLDEGRFFWALYEELVENGSYSQSEYEETFLSMVRDLPFAVFVKVEDSPQDVYDDVIQKSIQIDDYDFDIEFIDIRGMGDTNRGTIQRATELLDDYHENIEYDRYENEQELVIRVLPNTIN